LNRIIIFGGSGFVGSYLTKYFLKNNIAKIILKVDISAPERIVNGVDFIKVDIRNPIDPKIINDDFDAIINLAAVHKSPGHPRQEYFETNILGAKNICVLAEQKGISRIVFTSSISVYGPDEAEKTEDSLTMPSIPYGISKLAAEYIHREWQLKAPERKLAIIRPAVIFGKGEKGNFTRIASALKKGIFVYPGRKDTIKACVYVKDVCRLIMQLMTTDQDYCCYNLCYPEKTTIEDVCKAFHKALGFKLPRLKLPECIINAGASILKNVNTPFVRGLGLDPARIAKLVNSTNISSKKLMDSGFVFNYDLVSAIKDWANDCGGKELY
jgi:nucleoside-diphosphate-sugar epimerase